MKNASYYYGYGYDILDICQTGLIEITLIFTYSSMGVGEVNMIVSHVNQKFDLNPRSMNTEALW